MTLANKVALITGGSRGIGAAIAQRFCSDGAMVVIAGTNADNLKKCQAAIKAATGKDALARVMDVADPDSCVSVIDEVSSTLGRLDILVCSAGIIRRTPFLEIPLAEWQQIFDTDVRGTFLCCQQAARHMRQGGSIINISSILGKYAGVGMAHYVAAKAAVDKLTVVMALELASRNIRVNAIAPGIISTDMTARRREEPEAVAGWLQRIALNRLGVAEEISGVAAFLASDDAAYLTGQIIYVDGGWKAY